MRSSPTPILAAASALFATGVHSLASHCPVDGEICYQVGVPPESAAAGSGPLYFQITALDTYQWVALGTGTQMTGANMFIIYQDGTGNLTVSARSARGHTQPQAQGQTQLELLAGSGVVDGIMTANVLCANCDSWSGGQMSLSDSDTPWIGAWKKGNPLNSPSVSAQISQHNSHDNFGLDLSQAVVTSAGNPFIGQGGGSGDGSGNGDGDGSNGRGGSSPLSGGGSGNSGASRGGNSGINLILLHGIIMTVVFAFMYPIGAALMPLVGKWFIHAGWQMLAFVGMWAGFGVGYKKADELGILFKQPHTVLGTVVVCAMIIQPVAGFMHHRYYKKHQARGAISYIHIWYGRILMIIGIINGGLGLQLAAAPRSFVIAYSVVAVIASIIYAISQFVGGMRSSRREKEAYSPGFSNHNSPQHSQRNRRPVQYSPVQQSFGRDPYNRGPPARGNDQYRDQYGDQYRDQYRDQYNQRQYR